MREETIIWFYPEERMPEEDDKAIARFNMYNNRTDLHSGIFIQDDDGYISFQTTYGIVSINDIEEYCLIR